MSADQSRAYAESSSLLNTHMSRSKARVALIRKPAFDNYKHLLDVAIASPQGRMHVPVILNVIIKHVSSESPEYMRAEVKKALDCKSLSKSPAHNRRAPFGRELSAGHR